MFHTLQYNLDLDTAYNTMDTGYIHMKTSQYYNIPSGYLT
jgi:hypothetical protein